MNKPIVGKAVFSTEGGTNIIYDGTYNGKPCYCIVHTGTGHMEIIDRDENILKQVLSKISRCKAVVCDKKRTGYILKFHKTKRERSISLRLYVYAKYHGLALDKVRHHKIMLVDDSLCGENISDLRKENLYDAGGFRPVKNNNALEIIERPEHTGERYIIVKTYSPKMDKIEAYEYDEPLYRILASSRYCTVAHNKGTGRQSVVVHYGRTKSNYIIMNLSRFVALYRTYFDRYRNRPGAISRFIKDIPLLNEKHGEFDAGHIDANLWNGTSLNLIWMRKDTNNKMNDLIRSFVGEYDAFAACNDAGEILVEFSNGGEPFRFRCPSAEHYLDLQKVFAGRCRLTDKVKIHHVTDTHVDAIPTPKDSLKYHGKRKDPTFESVISKLWQYLDRRDSMLTAYRDNSGAFSPWSMSADGITGEHLEAALGFILRAVNNAIIGKEANE